MKAIRQRYRETDREDECRCATAFKGRHQGEDSCPLTKLDADVLVALEAGAAALDTLVRVRAFQVRFSRLRAYINGHDVIHQLGKVLDQKDRNP